MLPIFNIQKMSSDLIKARQEEKKLWTKFKRSEQFRNPLPVIKRISQSELMLRLYIIIADDQIPYTTLNPTRILERMEEIPELVNIRQIIREDIRTRHWRDKVGPMLQQMHNNNSQELQSRIKKILSSPERQYAHRDKLGKLTAPKMNPGQFFVFRESYPDLYELFYKHLSPILTSPAITGIDVGQAKLKVDAGMGLGALAAAFINEDTEVWQQIAGAIEIELTIFGDFSEETWNEVFLHLPSDIVQVINESANVYKLGNLYNYTSPKALSLGYAVRVPQGDIF
jgi:hypothetical protein